MNFYKMPIKLFSTDNVLRPKYIYVMEIIHQNDDRDSAVKFYYDSEDNEDKDSFKFLDGVLYKRPLYEMLDWLEENGYKDITPKLWRLS